MGEVLFYHLTDTPLERTLPVMLEKSLERGWRALVRATSDQAVTMLDTQLWSYRKDSFLPHGLGSDAHSARHPVCLTCDRDNPNAADVLMLVDGARIEAQDCEAFARVCLLFDGADQDAVAAARADWTQVKASGIAATYWAQDAGKWVKRATSTPK